MTRTKTPWQQRAIAGGLRQQTLVTLTGHDKTTIARQLRGYWQSGIPKHIRSMIIAWEVMTPDQREHWLKLVEGDPVSSPARRAEDPQRRSTGP